MISNKKKNVMHTFLFLLFTYVHSYARDWCLWCGRFYILGGREREKLCQGGRLPLNAGELTALLLEGCTPLINRVRCHLASQCFEIGNLAVLPCLSKCQKNVENGVDALMFCVRCALLVAFSTSCHRKSNISKKFEFLRLVLLSNLTGASFVC